MSHHPTPTYELLAELPQLTSGATVKLSLECWRGWRAPSLRIARMVRSGSIYSFSVSPKQRGEFARAVWSWLRACDDAEALGGGSGGHAAQGTADGEGTP